MAASTWLAGSTCGRPHISYYDATNFNFDLRYATFDGSAWQTEVVDAAGHAGEDSSLALDQAGRPHISYYDSNNTALKYTWGECAPAIGASIAGPAALGVGKAAVYAATPAPPTATLPVTFTWDNGTVGPAAVYSWTVPGLYTLTVTATNPCGQGAASFAVGVWPYQVYLPLAWRR